MQGKGSRLCVRQGKKKKNQQISPLALERDEKRKGIVKARGLLFLHCHYSVQWFWEWPLELPP